MPDLRGHKRPRTTARDPPLTPLTLDGGHATRTALMAELCMRWRPPRPDVAAVFQRSGGEDLEPCGQARRPRHSVPGWLGCIRALPPLARGATMTAPVACRRTTAVRITGPWPIGGGSQALLRPPLEHRPWTSAPLPLRWRRFRPTPLPCRSLPPSQARQPATAIPPKTLLKRGQRDYNALGDGAAVPSNTAFVSAARHKNSYSLGCNRNL
jgi:hypothetical protein